MTDDPKLQAKIEEAELDGWSVAEEKEYVAVMKNRSFGSLKRHIGIFILTFYTLGIANILYALYRFLRPKKMVLRGGPQKELEKEELKQKQKMKEEQGKNAREAMRTIRKFF